MNPFVPLAQSNLESLRYGFSHGALKYEMTPGALLHSGANAETAAAISEFVQKRGYSSETIAAIIEAILESRAQAHNVALLQSLVVTGPEVPDLTNLKTGSRFIQVVEHAKNELMLATFALYQGDRILEPIHQAMVRNPELRVTLILNVQRGYGDTTINEDILEKFRLEFRAKNWPWEIKPEVYYYPESLHMDAKSRASMHAKFVIADEERCFITSANFTEAAQKKNIEVGIELTGSHEPKALSRYFKHLIANGCLLRIL
jgi:phosphatidylserine/phosphatidylglycerophosphate/cardiolipin synthase-like enzyme